MDSYQSDFNKISFDANYMYDVCLKFRHYEAVFLIAYHFRVWKFMSLTTWPIYFVFWTLKTIDP